MLRYLSARASVHFACRVSRPGALEPGLLDPYCVRASFSDRRPDAGAAARPASVAHATRKSLTEVVRAWARETRFHAVVVATAGEMVPLPAPALRGVPLLLDVGGLPDGAAHRLGPRDRRLRALAHLGDRALAVTVPTESDAERFRQMAPDSEVVCLPDGVDLLRYQPSGPRAAAESCLLLSGDGGLGSPEVLGWFRDEVWAAVLARRPHAALRFAREVGAAASAAFPAFGTGRTSRDLRRGLAGAAVALAPLPGSSASVLRALASGKAVVACERALEGLPDRLDTPILLADSSAEWVDHILRLFGDPALPEQLGRAGRAYAEAHAWERCLRPLDELLGLPPPVGPAPTPLFPTPHFHVLRSPNPVNER